MPNQVFITDADVFQRIGGKAALLNCSIRTGPGAGIRPRWTAKQDACNFVLEAAGVAADLGGFQASGSRPSFRIW